MKRKVTWVVVVAAAVLAIGLWRCRGHGKAEHAAATKAVAGGEATQQELRRKDPHKLDRATIAGTITGEDHAPIAAAQVCADFWSPQLSSEDTREPRCAKTDTQGHYELRDLLAAEYRIVASARSYRPTTYHPDPDGERDSFELAAGEHKSGVDLVLRHDGVEITGTVSDVTGGPIAHAQVRAAGGRWGGGAASPPVETDEQGKFSMWVKPGTVRVTADADGYASGSDGGKAPGHFEILLTPESSLSGTVIDAKTNQPVAGVQVQVSPGDWFFGDSGGIDLSDEQGHFRVTRLDPGRYSAIARAPNAYGRSEGSVLVGLGQHVDGVVVKLFPAYRIAGRIVLPDGKTTCPNGSAYFRDSDRDRWANTAKDPDGTIHADGVLPGKYTVELECEGYQSRDKYPPIEIKDKDATDLVWQVDAGATIRGKVLTKSGAPVEDADVWARTTGGAARAKTGWGGATSKRDGAYKLTGLKAGTFTIEVSTSAGVGPKDGFKVDVPAGGTVEKDLVLDDVGTIQGVVADSDGKPVGGVQIDAMPITGGWRFGGEDVRSSDDGTFTIDGLRAGDYRVMAHRGWWSDTLRKPGSNDDAKQGERATVLAGKTAQVRLVVENQTGTIKGTVLDSDGKPVADAFVTAARESDAAGTVNSSVSATRWSFDEKPVVTSVDGAFVVAKLSPGKYTLRAYRKGGGEAVAEHVPVNTTAKLQITPTGTLDGTVRIAGSSQPPVDLEVELVDAKSGFERSEHFYRTDGRFSMRDLPAGHFKITATAENGKKQQEVDLGEGEHKAVSIELDALLTVTGRIIELSSGQPVAGIVMNASIGTTGRGGGMFVIGGGGDDELANVSGEDGRFTIKNAPKGPVTLSGYPKDFRQSDYDFIRTTRTLDGATTVDIGDIKVIKRRVKMGDPAGELGFHFAEQPDDTPIDQQQKKISWIDPAGPAAKLDLKVGDVIVAIDGIDITGANVSYAWTLLRAPPGTPLKLGLARGVTVTLVLAVP